MTPPPAAAPALHPRRSGEPAQDRRRRSPAAVPRHPRRVSGPARRNERDRRSQGRAGAALVLIGLLESLAPRALLARLSRHRPRALGREAVFGRAWIAVVAFALIGIVTMQLGLLKLNAGIGRALEHTALLQRENAALSVENSEMAASDRVQARAAGLGMESVQPGALRFLTANPRSDVARGAAALNAPPAGSQTGSAESQLGSSTGAQQSASVPERRSGRRRHSSVGGTGARDARRHCAGLGRTSRHAGRRSEAGIQRIHNGVHAQLAVCDSPCGRWRG